MKSVTNVGTVPQMLVYAQQKTIELQQTSLQILLREKKGKDSLHISDVARSFSKEKIEALIDQSANVSASELSYYFAHYNNPKSILDAINFGKNVSCGYDPAFKEYGIISFEYNGSRQVVPNYAVPKINPNTLPKIYAENNSLKLNDKSYFVWITEGGGKYTWAVNGGNVGWVSSESLLSDNTMRRGENYKWEMRKVSDFLSALAKGKSVGCDPVGLKEALAIYEKVGISPGFFSVDAGAGKHLYFLEESGRTINVGERIERLNGINWMKQGYKEGDVFLVFGKEYAIDQNGYLHVSEDDDFTSEEIKFPQKISGNTTVS